MLVICKSNQLTKSGVPHYFLSITKDKHYEVYEITDDPRSVVVYGSDISTGKFYQIKDNSGLVAYYPSELFIPLSEIREKKINKILT
jgi:hypothetical protein